MEPDRIALKTLGLATLGVVGIDLLTGMAIGLGHLTPLTGTAFARLFAIAWMAGLISRRPLGWASVGLDGESWKPGLLKGLMWSAGFGAAAAIGWGALYALGIDPLRFIPPPPVVRRIDLAALFLVGGLIAPVAEEIFFRGLIYGYCRRWGFWPALVLSTLIFTLLHAEAAAVPIPQIVGGLVFAVAYEIEKKLLVPIIIHVLGNLALFSLAYV
jgi:hypothetical protein